MMRTCKRFTSALLGTGLVALALATPAASGAASDPLVIFTPTPPTSPNTPPTPPPTGLLNSPCGLAVDPKGRIYVSDYYHHAVDVFTSLSTLGYAAQLSGEDPLDGPCGLALDASERLYVNNYHRNVARFGQTPGFTPGPIFPLPEEDTEHHLPTGVAVGGEASVYVNYRTFVGVYDSLGNPELDEGVPLRIGEGTLEDGYGVAVSGFVGTLGRVYVPDAGTNTVKVYDPAVDKVNPTAEIKDPFSKPFVSLRDSAIAVDNVTGRIYFADNTQPNYTERPQATIHAYNAANLYAGHLKYNVIDALPPGLAVDNSINPTQGRVYVTSGNTSPASIYAYGPNATVFGTPLPPGGLSVGGSGGGGAAAGDASPSTTEPAPTLSNVPRASPSAISQQDNLRVSVDGRLAPRRLPRKGTAPISVTVGWDIASTDGAAPPKLKGLEIAINRKGRLDYRGLPVCPYAKIQPASTKRALSNCRSSLVGKGTFTAEIGLKGQESEAYEAKGRLLVFKGEEKRKPVLYGQIYADHPFATSFVIVFELSKRKKGTYGTVLSAKLPRALRAWGNLTAVEMKLKRRYGYGGRRHSFLSAGCPAPKGFKLASFKLARASFAFNGGKRVASTVTGSCRTRE